MTDILKFLNISMIDYNTKFGKRCALVVFCFSAFVLTSPQNMLSPALTTISDELGFNNIDRDYYIGGCMSLGFSVLPLPLTMLTGFFADTYNRHFLLSFTLLSGGISIISFGLTTSYPLLLFNRIVSGTCLGAFIPISFSMVGDIFESKDRNTVSTIISASLGGGALFGQLLVGYSLAYYGWRLPFAFVGFLCIVLSLIFFVLLYEPKRGCKEESLQDTFEKGELITFP